MNHKIFFPSLLLLFMLLVSCGSNRQKEPSYNHFTLEEKKFVHALFLSEYLWYDKVKKDINYTAFTTPQELVDALRVYPSDRWSFTISKQQYEDYVNQKTSGFGFGYISDFTIYTVRIDSPAYKKLFRGDTILKINGENVSHEKIAQAAKNTNIKTRFTVERNHTEVEVNITPKEYTFKVSLGKIITHNNLKVGYLRYDSFSGSSVEELEKIFTKFKDNHISELVIDLRYNGGGSITVASALLDNITNAYPGQRQGYLDWNDKYKDKNEDFSFEELDDQDGNELSMQRVVFLVTKNSASASELVISALKPYLGDMNVITVGKDTHGKPVGMSGKVFNDNYYFLINFIVRNKVNETTPFEGIAVTCKAEDNLSYQRGDINEPMLKTALYYIDYDSCP